LTAPDEDQGGFGFVDFILVEADGLIETIDASRLQSGFLELLDRVGLSFAKTFAAGVAAFERVVCQEFDVRPPGVLVEVGSGGSLLGWRSGSKSKKKDR
jgi:hypothetical protein